MEKEIKDSISTTVKKVRVSLHFLPYAKRRILFNHDNCDGEMKFLYFHECTKNSRWKQQDSVENYLYAFSQFLFHYRFHIN